MLCNGLIYSIKDLCPGQILAYYKFFPVQEESSFSLYKNDDNFFIFIFQSTNNDLLFLETSDFKVMDNISLFYFLAERLEIYSINEIVADVLKLEEFYNFQFSETITDTQLIKFYYRLEKSDFLQGTPLEKYAFTRDGWDVILFNDIKDTPIDVVSFVSNTEEVFSEFGNNFGFHFIKNETSKTALISFHPDLLFKDCNTDFYNIFITKYNVPLIDILSILKRESLEQIQIPLKGIFSYIYKTQILLKFFNFYNSNVRFELYISVNSFFAELYFTVHGGRMKKLELINFVASLQNSLKKVFSDYSESIRDNICNFYAFKVDMLSEGEGHCGKIVFRNNITLLSIVINSIQDRLNALDQNIYTFI